jgi:rRNA maturation endonuclease Nob1
MSDERKAHCVKCGAVAVVMEETLDPRHPKVFCYSCGKQMGRVSREKDKEQGGAK